MTVTITTKVSFEWMENNEENLCYLRDHEPVLFIDDRDYIYKGQYIDDVTSYFISECKYSAGGQAIFQLKEVKFFVRLEDFPRPTMSVIANPECVCCLLRKTKDKLSVK